MTRVNIPEDVEFEFVSDAELSSLIHEAQTVPEIQLEDSDVIGEAELLFDYTEAEWITELDLAFEQATSTTRFQRGVGYCENVKCDDYLKGLFLMLHEGDDFECPKCNIRSTHMIAERGIVDREPGFPFTTVRVEYCYEPARKKFDEIVSITDESYPGPGGTYTVLNPLCRTPNRAAKIAEGLLTIMNQGAALEDELSGDVPRTHETLLSFDKPTDEFRRDLDDLEHRLRDNSFLQQPSVFSANSEVELNLEEGDPSGPESNDLGGTTYSRPRVSPSGNSRAGTQHVHPGDQPGGIRPERSQSGLHSVQPMGTRREDLRRATREGRRSRHHRSAASKLRAAAGRYLSSVLRGKGRGSTPGT
jgi:hypothetical protein